MITIQNEQIVFTDIDDTLVLWDKNFESNSTGKIEVIDPYTNKSIFVTPHNPHIRLLLERKARGAYIIAMSHGGFAWASAVLKVLELTDIVDLVITKPILVLDDHPIDKALGHTTYLQPNSLWKQED